MDLKGALIHDVEKTAVAAERHVPWEGALETLLRVGEHRQWAVKRMGRTIQVDRADDLSRCGVTDPDVAILATREIHTRVSGENVTPMKVALTSIRLTAGTRLFSCVTSVRENGPAPLLSVASIRPSGDNAMPNGFGACTFTSTPAGVSSRPFGRIATRTPSRTVSVVAGRLPAGAEKFRKPESLPLACAPLGGDRPRRRGENTQDRHTACQH